MDLESVQHPQVENEKKYPFELEIALEGFLYFETEEEARKVISKLKEIFEDRSDLINKDLIPENQEVFQTECGFFVLTNN